jgi:hypothetical protein
MLHVQLVSGPAGVASADFLLRKSAIGMLYEQPLEAQKWDRRRW